ncbi:MAG: nucleotide pyrophosphohydrolase [Bacteriovoracaceae bacterium]|nr:nucleotide pyrophosphohydrolase [Bacteriovoracaceae bacterium]
MEKYNINIQDLVKRMAEFSKERDWDQFHTPKNLSMALSVECAELMEHFQWLSNEAASELTNESLENIKKREEIAEEICDILFYTSRISDVMNLDLVTAIEKKFEKNAKKYPAEKVRGSSKKYSEY